MHQTHSARTGRLAHLPVWLLLLLLAWAPLPVGSNRGWAQGILVVAAAGIALLTLAVQLHDRRPVVVPRRLVVAALLGLGVMGWMGVQGGSWLAEVPAAAAWLHPLWRTAAEAGLPVTPAISLDPAATRTALLLLAGYVLLFWVGFLLAQSRRRADRLAAGIVAIAAGWAVWGIVRFLAGLDLLFYPEAETSSGVTGNFPNRNHFVTYVNLALLVVAVRLTQPLLERGSVTVRVRTAIGEILDHLLQRRLWWFTAGFVLLVASLGSASRGGFLSLLAALACLAGLIVRRTVAGRWRSRLVVAVAALMAGVLVPLAGAPLLERLDQLDRGYVERDVVGPGRLASWEVALRLVEQRPWLGHGYGTFAQAFPLAADDRFAIHAGSGAYALNYDYAHNTYLENAVELGLPATLALHVAVALLASLCFMRRRGGERTEALPLAAAAGTVLVAVHALVDFSIQIPAVAATYAVILGLGCGRAAAARQTRPKGDQASVDEAPSFRDRRPGLA